MQIISTLFLLMLYAINLNLISFKFILRDFYGAVKNFFLYLFYTISRVNSCSSSAQWCFVIAPSIACHSQSSHFYNHTPVDQLATFFQMVPLSDTLEIDHGWYSVPHNILAKLFIGSLYKGNKKHRSIFTYHLFEVFQDFFRFG
jgi:hypothetical protein